MTHPFLCTPLLLATMAMAAMALSAVAQRAPMDPSHTLGVESCRECHDSIVESWERSRHATSLTTLTRSEAARTIAHLAGIKPDTITTSGSCARCHFTQETLSGALQTTAAVSCESCHGGASEWIDLHNSKSRSRGQRVAEASAHGMKHPAATFAVAKSCFECHVVDDEQLVNKAGHPALSAGFELLSWYSGDVKHNFLVSKEGKAVKSNSGEPQPLPASRQRVLYLSGKLLHLSHSLSAIASSTDAPVDKDGKLLLLPSGLPTYAVQHALTAQNLVDELTTLQKQLPLPELAQVTGLMSGTPLSTGHAEEIASAAREVERLAEQFSQKNDGANLAALDRIIAQLSPANPKAKLTSNR